MRTRALAPDDDRSCDPDGSAEKRRRLARLSVGDLMTFWAETPDTPMHIALAGVLEPPAGVTVEDLRDELAARTTRVPELSQRVYWTHRGEGRPLLVGDDHRHIENHIRVLSPEPLDDRSRFEQLAADRARVALDHDRPLWRADLIPDTDSPRVGIVFVVHHGLADGIRGIVLAATMFDATPMRATTAPRPPAPPVPTRAELLSDQLARVGDAARYAGALVGPGCVGARDGHTKRGWSDLRTSLRELRVAATPTRLDGHLGAERDLRVVRRPLEELRAVGHAHGATINDVLLTAVSGGMRDLLLAHGERTDGLELRVSIPVASPPGERNAGGSMPIVTWMPVGDPDPLVRLAAIHRDLAVHKAHRDRSYAGVTESPLMPTFVMRGLTRFMRSRGARMVNLYVTNVPGPAQPLWLGPARLVRPLPIAPLVAGARISIAALSYDGELAIAVHTDAALAHTARLATGIEATLDALAASIPPI